MAEHRDVIIIPSIAVVNPALTGMANALRAGERIRQLTGP
jgi:hypothetical protein